MLMIGICGASGSGKSTLAKELANKLNQRCVYLKQDSYYKDHPDMSFEERERINYDEPSAFEYEALLADLHELRAGRPITTKNYDYSQHRRCDSTERIEPADVVLLEGIHVFYDEAVRDLLDFKIFIQVVRTCACFGASSATSATAAAAWRAFIASIWRASSPCMKNTYAITSSMPI